MKIHKRILTMFLAVMLCMSTFAGISVQAAATTVYMLELPRGADPNKSGWGYSSHTLMNGASLTGSNTGKWYMYATDSYNGPIAYCIEPGVGLTSGTSMGARGEDYWDNYPSHINPTIPPYIVKAYIGRILQYGYTGTLNTNWSSAVGGHDTAIAQAIATQLLIWETIVGERDSSFNHIWASSVGRSNVIDIIASNHPLRNLIFSYYSSMEAQVQQHTKLPSFFSHSSGAAVEMTWNGSLYTATFTDTNGVLGNYNFSANKTGVNISVSGNTLTVTTATPPTGNITITASKKNGSRYGVVVWSDGIINDGKQDLATYSAGVSDPVTGYLNLEVKTGNMRLVKTAEDGNVGGIGFNISGNGVNTNRTTNTSGEISVVGLAPGVYTVTEQSPTHYQPTQAQQITIISGQTTTVNFNNVLKRGSLQVIKTSEDSFVEGMTFKLSGTSMSGAAVEQYATTNADGVAIFNDVLISGTTPYVLEEVDTPTRYVVPPSQNVAIEWNTVTNKTVHNTLKKFRVTVTKTDVETSTPQGDGTLAGAVYGIYKNATLIDTYTTDANGQFTTEYYVCGDDWTIKEITPSEGYLLDDTVHTVGASAGNFTIELNNITNAVTERVIKGNIAIIKHSDDGETQIETPEVGAEFQIFLKSSGSYESAVDSERDIIITDENGYAESKQLPYGIYTVRQTKGLEGAELMPDFDVYISENGHTYRYILNNKPFESFIKIVKKDAETGVTIPYAGSGFQIYNPAGELISMTFTYPTPTTIDTFYTNAEGYLVTPEMLPFGDGYTLVEVQAPYGYVLDATPIPFNVREENSETEGGVVVVAVEKLNMPQKGTISITKTGEVFSSVANTDNVYQPVYSVQGLPGAVYEVTAAEDIYTLDETLRTAAGTVVATITTSDSGIATTESLYLGKYTVKEITAPHGMVINPDVHEVELSYAGQEIETTTTDTAFYNERQKVEISLIKTMEIDNLFGVGDNGEILSVAFGIYARNDVTAADGTAIPTDGLVEVVSVSAEGKATFGTDLPFGAYYIKEVATHEGYILSDTEYDVVFDYAGQDISSVAIVANDGTAIHNEIIRGDIHGVKVGENDEPLENAEIGLFVMNGDTPILKTITDENGKFSFVGIPYGTYIIKEITPPEGYVLTEMSFVVNVTGEPQNLEIVIPNEKIRGSVQLTKTDADYPDNKLTGAIFEVFEDANGNETHDKDDVLISEMSELTGGVYQLDDLVYGGYFVKEKTAPTGFVLDTNAYYFEILEHEKVVVIETEAGKGFLNNAQKGALKIAKRSVDGALQGFSFLVQGVDFMGIPYARQFVTDENGEINITGLRIGEYTISEVLNDASSKYVLPPAQTITITADITTEISFFNDYPNRPEVPKTADNRNPEIWVAVFITSVLGLAACGTVIFCTKRKGK